MRGPLSPSEDFYRTLQVEPHADLEAIHAAYRRLARLYHPDLNPTPEAAERMRAINGAYRVLSDPRQRAAYDARRFLQAAPTAATAVAQRSATRPQPRRVVVTPDPPPTPLQRRVDRIFPVAGVLVIITLILLRVALVSLPPTASVPPHPVSTSVPERLRLDAGLRSFPGTVLVAPSSLAPFKDLPILRLDATGQGIARYAVYYGDLTTGVASITGLIGRTSFDAAAPHLTDCAPDAAYCAGPGVGQSAADPPGLELFRPEHLVGDAPAFATHRVCCNGVYWSLNWYEPHTNMSYTIDLSRNVAAQFDTPAAVGALAGQLVRLP